MAKPIVIKVGGRFFSDLASITSKEVNAQNADKLNSNGALKLLRTLANLQVKKQAVVLVHGGGEQVLQRLKDLGMQSKRKNGLRVTPDKHMPIVCSVLAGELNKQLVATAAKYGINAVGISLADGELADCQAMSAELGAVGVPTANSPDLLNALFNVNLLPIVASVGKDNTGRLYNINADHAAICLAELLQTELYFFADVPGVLDANKHLINTISKKEFDALVNDEVITDGMVVKVEAALKAANQIQQPVTIASWDNSYALLVDKKPCGTQILPDLLL